jgi:hypothetical protein
MFFLLAGNKREMANQGTTPSFEARTLLYRAWQIKCDVGFQLAARCGA